MTRQAELVEALVAYASRDGLGERVAWEEIVILIADLAVEPGAPTALRRHLGRLNDRDVAATLEDWFLRAAAERDLDAKHAARPSDKLLAPMQAVAFGAAGTAALLAMAGTLPLGAAILAGTAALALAGTTSYGRWTLSRREDLAQADAATIRRCAEIAGRCR